MKVKSMITIIASVLASLVLLAGCSQPVSQSSLNAESDDSESRAVLGTPALTPTNGATLVAGPFYDLSKQIETRIYYKSVEGQWNTVAAAVGPEDILIGGGATVDYPGVWGAMLTGSFPQQDATGAWTEWVAQSKDHLVECRHTTYVFAIGMRLKDIYGNYIPKATVEPYISVESAPEFAGGWEPDAMSLATCKTLAQDRILLSGGAQVVDPFGVASGNANGQLLTNSMKRRVTEGWGCQSQSCQAPCPRELISYMISASTAEIPGFGRLKAFVDSISKNTTPYTPNAINVPRYAGYVISGVGGMTIDQNNNRYLTGLGISLDGRSVYASDKDHAVASGAFSSLTGACLGIMRDGSTDFVSVWNTENLSEDSSAANQIRLPIHTNYDYATYANHCSIDWGDNTSTVISQGDVPELTHTYSYAGTYTIRIKGIMNGFFFYTASNGESNTGDNLKLLEIKQWGPFAIQQDYGTFSGCENLTITATDKPDISGTTELHATFLGCKSITAIPNMNSWDVSHVRTLFQVFEYATNFNEYIGDWNVGNVTDMSFLFDSAEAFNQDISRWNVSKVERMVKTFAYTLSFDQDIGGWDVSNVKNMCAMFIGSNFNRDIGNWNVSNVTDASSMFAMNPRFNQDISRWQPVSLTEANAMFQFAESFNQDIGTWKLSKVTNMRCMFHEAKSFNQDLSAWDFSSVTNMFWMFNGASAFDQNLGNWNISRVTDMTEMLRGSGLSTAHYDALLNGWASRPVQPGIQFIVGTDKKYSSIAAQARAKLTSAPNNWIIRDGGMQ